MTVTVHNPDQYMVDLRTMVAQGRKRIGFLFGAGAAAGMRAPDGTSALIPAIQELTGQVLAKLPKKFESAIADAVKRDPNTNIEKLLSHFRALSNVIGETEVSGLDASGYVELSNQICLEIGKIVDVRLPDGDSPFRDTVNWIVGAVRDHPVEIFTTNYDLLIEEALERVRAPYFDGFTGSREPFFDTVAVANNDLPPRWTRLWKLHGSLGWKANSKGEMIRTGDSSATHLIFPEHLKYDQTQKAPYVALFDRLGAFLRTEDTLLIAIGFSFADAHVASKVDEALAANPSASVFAFQFRDLDDEQAATDLAHKRPNFSAYCRNRAVINGVAGDWKPGDPLSRDWHVIRSTYWGGEGGASPQFLLGDFTSLARFLALSRTPQAFGPVPITPTAPPPEPEELET